MNDCPREKVYLSRAELEAIRAAKSRVTLPRRQKGSIQNIIRVIQFNEFYTEECQKRGITPDVGVLMFCQILRDIVRDKK